VPSHEDAAVARPWTLRRAATGYVGAWLFYTALSGACGAAGLTLPIGPHALVVDGTLIATVYLLIRGCELHLSDLGICRPTRPKALAFAIRALLALVVLDGAWSLLVGERALSSPLRGLAAEGTLVIVLTGVATAVTAPVAEELFFRGFIYRSLRSAMSPLPAAAVDSAMFALVHSRYPPAALVPVAFFGLVSCLVYERTGSLLPGIALHALVDSSGFELALSGRVVVAPLLAILITSAVALQSRQAKYGPRGRQRSSL
jgi:membrane protease YdiL (CAAX protease family)